MTRRAGIYAGAVPATTSSSHGPSKPLAVSYRESSRTISLHASSRSG